MARGSSSCFVRKPLQTSARSEEIDHSRTLSNHIYRILLLLAGELQEQSASENQNCNTLQIITFELETPG